MVKKILYLDIDDVIKDTDNVWREALNCKNYNGCIYEKGLSESDRLVIREIMSDYSRIPFIDGALEGISLLKEHYEIVLCSSYLNDYEYEAKVVLAEILGLNLIGCGPEDKPYKSGVNMQGAIFVDDSISNLVHSKADVKVLFICEGTLHSVYNFNEGYNNAKVHNWGELIKFLVPKYI